MPRRRKLKSATLAASASAVVHDRIAAAPFNAKIALSHVEDAYGIAEFPRYDERRGELISQGAPKVNVVRSLRDDPLAAMEAAGQIDSVQFLAGRHWQFAYVRCEIGGVRAIDPTKEAVDGGRLADPLNEVVKKAIADIARASSALGNEGDSLIRDVLGSKKTVAMAADARGLGTESGRKYLGKRFRECLDTLAGVFGYATA